MELTLNHAAEIALRTLGDEDRRKVHAWFDYLRNWERDEWVRSHSSKLDLPGPDTIYVLQTGTDLRIFFDLHADRIEVVDIARHASLSTVRQAS
jgi:hypothetical protein